MQLTVELLEALKHAYSNEGVVHGAGFKRMKEYHQLERMGLITLDMKAIGMGIVYLTESGKSYLPGEETTE
ncbi:hypothetical protein M2277_000834 [Paenibacillus sp. LBL]|uniref:hypothetical protein n=1 Tax=Paenibacillus sp. LBL TaxID=2940563 RepID=UPI0024748E88|nr:hypothetical protein [Paenibacillus sp. LBL]MDH6670190.1 hypothetical protein [Paenibacillus sp. LBL]